MPTINTYGYDYTDPRTPPFAPRQRKPWELDGLEEPAPLDSQPPPLPQLSAQPEQAPPAPQPQQAQPSPMAGLRSVVAQGPPPLPKMNPWKQAGEIATGMFLGRGAAEAIWHPKYNRQVEEYGQRVGQAKAVSDIDVAIQNQQQTIAKAEAAIEASKATANRNQKQGSLYQAQETKLGAPPDRQEITKEAADRLGIMPDEDGRYWVERNQINAIRPPAERVDPNPNEAALRLRAAQGDPAAKAAVASMDAARAARRGNGGGTGDMNGSTARIITNDKGKAYADAEDRFNTAINLLKIAERRRRLGAAANKGDTNAAAELAAMGSAFDAKPPEFATEDDAKAWLAKEKQRIENSYAEQVSAVTGSPVAPYQYGAQPPQSPPPLQGLGNQAAARKTYSEAEVRERAKASGKDPNEAVAKAKAAGLLR